MGGPVKPGALNIAQLRCIAGDANRREGPSWTTILGAKFKAPYANREQEIERERLKKNHISGAIS
jgi:hypothetical protein